jgi:hypothetical protein
LRAVVADNFSGEDRGLKSGLRELNMPYVMALKPSHAWYHPQDVAGTLQDVAHEAGWMSAEQPGQWRRIRRTFRDGSTQDWWALEIVAGPYGPDKKERAIVASTDPQTLPDLSTWYLVTNLPTPMEQPESEPLFSQPVSKRSSGSTDCHSRATSRSNMLQAGRSTRYEATRRSDDIGNSSAVPSRSAAITPVTPLTTRRQLLWSRLCHPFLRKETFLFKKQERGKKSARK